MISVQAMEPIDRRVGIQTGEEDARREVEKKLLKKVRGCIEWKFENCHVMGTLNTYHSGEFEHRLNLRKSWAVDLIKKEVSFLKKMIFICSIISCIIGLFVGRFG